MIDTLSEKTREALREYLSAPINQAELLWTLRAINDERGSLEDFDYYQMCDFNEIIGKVEPYRLAMMIECGDFSPLHNLFKFGSDGNLYSTDVIQPDDDDWEEIFDCMETDTSLEYLPSDIAKIIEKNAEKETEEEGE